MPEIEFGNACNRYILMNAVQFAECEHARGERRRGFFLAVISRLGQLSYDIIGKIGVELFGGSERENSVVWIRLHWKFEWSVLTSLYISSAVHSKIRLH